MRRDVVITGMGILSSAGPNLAAARERFLAGICCLTPIANPQAARLRAKFAGQLSSADAQLAGVPATPDFQSSTPLLAGHDRHVFMALAAAREALQAAAAQPQNWGRRMGLLFSTCSGPMLLIESHYERIIRGQPQLSAAELFAKRYYSGAQVLAQTLGVGGLCTTVVTACSASTAAISLAADLIRCGMLDAALAGGADSFSVSTLAGFDGLKATSEGKCAPFSKPSGLNLGEAAAFVFLESADSARQRGVAIHARVLGSGMSNDAHHCSAPEPGGRGLSEAMRRALADAKLTPEQIAYVNAHGTGTEANDKAECRALRKVFGERVASLPVSSTKSMVGHCLGAAGAVEAIASIVCARAKVLPPTANFTEPREGCAVDCVPDAGRSWPGPEIFLSNNSAFGGHNTSLALAAGEAVAKPLPTDDQEPLPPIYITACGVVTPAGVGLAALETAEREKRACLRLTPVEGTSERMAGLLDEALVEAADRRLNLRAMDRASKWATVATRLAIREGKFPEKPAALAELGIFLNLGAGPSWAESEFLTSFLGNDHQVAQLSAFPYIVPSSVAGNVCRALMLSGHNVTLNPGPAAGLFGLEPALAALRCGHAGALLCGAVDELSPRILADTTHAGQVPAYHSQPPGEGAAVFLLETAAHAAARGATPLGEIGALVSVTKPSLSPSDVEEIVAAVLAESKVTWEAIRGFAYTGPEVLLPTMVQGKERVQTSVVTGVLEGAQPLLDMALALRLPDLQAGDWVLNLAATSHGLAGAMLVKKC